MSIYVVTYDLKKAGQKYTDLIKRLESYPAHWHYQGSCWFLDTPSTAVAIRDNLRPCLDANDTLLVARLSGEAAWYGFSDAGSKWLKERLDRVAA